MMNNVWSSAGRASLSMAAVLLLAACGTRYSAPLDDQSAVLDRSRAPIYTTNTPSSASGVVVSGPNGASGGRSGVTESQPIGSAASGAGIASTTADTAGVRVEPASGVSLSGAGADTDIQRRGLERTPIGGQTSTTPAPSFDSGALSAPVIPLITEQAPTPPDNAPDYADEALIMPPAQSQVQAAPVELPDTHTVARGETLYSIAWQYSLDYRALAVANNLSADYTIYPNQQLTLNVDAVSNNALDSVPAIPPAPAGDTEVLASGRSAEAMASRRMIDVPVRVVDDISWQWPVDGQVLNGFRDDTTSISRGIDIDSQRGDPVYAAADGDVVYSGRGIQGQGNLVIIRHSARHLSAYSHNSNMLVTEGARIRAGDKIAEVGEDGHGTELLHFEVRVDGVPVNPSLYLPAL